MAQTNINTNLSGVVVDTLGHPIESATVLIFSNDNSNFITSTITDTSGIFNLKNIPSRQYSVHINHIRYKPIQIGGDNNNLPDTITMYENSYLIDKVVVMANVIKHQTNKYVVSLKRNPITKGKSVYETLGLLPGISTNSGLSINGISGTQVYINGRKIKDQKELESIQAINVDSVAVVFNTSGLYDAQLKGGRIDIALNHTPRGGVWGSVGGNIMLRPKYGVGADNVYSIINYGHKKLGIYNYISYNGFENIDEYDVKSIYSNPAINIDMSTNETGYSHDFRDNLNFTYDFNDKHTIGVSFDISTKSYTLSNNSSSIKYNTTKTFFDKSSSELSGNGRNTLFQPVLNYTYKIDKKGSYFKLVADYLTNVHNSEHPHPVFPPQLASFEL